MTSDGRINDGFLARDSGGDTAFVKVLRHRLERRIGRQIAQSLVVEDRVRNWVSDDIVMAFEVDLLNEELPPATLRDAARFEVPHFASWRDHFAATYRQRWWGRWLPQPRFVDGTVAHETVVTVRARWTYPRATRILPGRDFGHPVLRTDAVMQRAAVRGFAPWPPTD